MTQIHVKGRDAVRWNFSAGLGVMPCAGTSAHRALSQSKSDLRVKKSDLRVKKSDLRVKKCGKTGVLFQLVCRGG